MKIVLSIVIGLVGILLLLLITAAFTKKNYQLEREIVIHKPKQEVFDYIKYLKNQDHYSKWIQLDPQAKKEYKGTDATVGFVAAWNSEHKEVGQGEQTIINIIDGERVDLDLHFIKPFEGLAKAYMVTERISTDQTKVKWGFSSEMKYPMNIMLLFVNFEDMLGKDLDISLNNLKTILEK